MRYMRVEEQSMFEKLIFMRYMRVEEQSMSQNTNSETPSVNMASNFNPPHTCPVSSYIPSQFVFTWTKYTSSFIKGNNSQSITMSDSSSFTVEGWHPDY